MPDGYYEGHFRSKKKNVKLVESSKLITMQKAVLSFKLVLKSSNFIIVNIYDYDCNHEFQF